MKELSDAQKKERLQTLLDDALEQYREGNYQEAIARWEKVLELEPDNLEAKFNIEITKEKMKSLSKN
jgi:tetratricopeptide (TPR) repeat protein